MSAYAASVHERKNVPKNRKSKLNNGSKWKTLSPSLTEQTISGLFIRRKISRLAAFAFETSLAIIFGIFVIVNVFGRRLVTSKSGSSRRKNPYSDVQPVAIGKSGSYKDLSCPATGVEAVDQDAAQIRPPKCLENTILGVHKFIKIQGVKLHYVEAGGNKGRPVLLLLHGACDFWFTWRKLVPSLARRFRVICLDQRGCGDSEKPMLRSSYTEALLAEDVACFIRSVWDPAHDGNGGVSLVGTGWGGQLCWSVAERYPGLVRKMVLLHSPHPCVLRRNFSLKNYYSLWPVVFSRLPAVPEWAAREDNLSLVTRLLEPLVTSKQITEEEISAYYYNFSRTEDITGSLHHIRNWDPWRSAETAPHVLSTPTLLLMGDSDPYILLDAGYKSAEYVERIKTRVLVGGSSWSQVTHADNILEELSIFFNEPKILDSSYVSTDDEDWDEDVEEGRDDVEGTGSSKSIMGLMVGAGLSVVNRWKHLEAPK